MPAILLLQLIAHTLADFFLQPESWCRGKEEKGACGKYMYYHIFIVFVCSALLTPSWSFIPFALLIAVIHLAIDILKSEIGMWRKKEKSYLLFIFDQLLHLVAILAVVWFFSLANETPSYLGKDLLTIKQLLYALCLLLIFKPANILIREILTSLGLPAGNDQSLERAGRWIGASERVLIFILALLGEFVAIGFIATAKSILRFKPEATQQTEYVLIGTLMSYGIAASLAVGIRTGAFERLLNLF